VCDVEIINLNGILGHNRLSAEAARAFVPLIDDMTAVNTPWRAASACHVGAAQVNGERRIASFPKQLVMSTDVPKISSVLERCP
jgi:hypothetical protein